MMSCVGDTASSGVDAAMSVGCSRGGAWVGGFRDSGRTKGRGGSAKKSGAGLQVTE